MATSTYTVKSGDTLSQIAKNAGVGIGDISGYSSGDPNLIRPGEVLTIGAPKSTGGNSSADDYAAAAKSLLGGTSGSSSSSSGSSSTDSATDDYLSGLRDQISTATKAVQDAASQLSSIKTSAYNDAYAKSGLDAVKSNIANLDSEIADQKAQRDAAIAKVKNNPGLSAALLTGTVSKLSDKANATINDLIAQRNSLAGDYNTGLTEVENVANNAAGDALDAYNTANNALSSLTGQANNYQSALLDALKTGNTQDYQNSELAIQLMNAQSNAQRAANSGSSSSDWKLATSPLTGEALYWYNSNGDTKALSAADKANLAASASAPAAASDTGSDTTDTSASTPWYQGILNFFTGGGS